MTVIPSPPRFSNRGFSLNAKKSRVGKISNLSYKMTVSTDNLPESRRIGPHWAAIFGHHPAQLMAAAILFLFPLYEQEVASIPHAIVLLRLLESMFVDTVQLAPSLGTALTRIGLMWGVVVLLWSIVSYKYTEFLLTEDALIVNSGVLSQTSNTIRYDLIYDCDISRVIGERAVGLGTVIVRPVNLKNGQPETRVEMGFVNDPEEVRRFINSRAPKIRTVGNF